MTSVPRRQARGRRRMEEILVAAARVFAARGYEGATTNAVAAEAGISPGSLYQYFANKEELARALAEQYATSLDAAQQSAFAHLDLAGMSVAEIVHAVIEPLVTHNHALPGFKAILARTDMPDSLQEAVGPVQARFEGRLGTLISTALPDLDPDAASRATAVVMQIAKGMLVMISEAPAEERAALVAELEQVLTAYLQSLSTRESATTGDQSSR